MNRISMHHITRNFNHAVVGRSLGGATCTRQSRKSAVNTARAKAQSNFRMKTFELYVESEIFPVLLASDSIVYGVSSRGNQA